MSYKDAKTNQYSITGSESQVQLIVGERAEDEQPHHIMACNDYLRMGRGRSIPKLHEHYVKMVEIAKEKGQPIYDVPTESKGTMHAWSTKFGWVQRADAYDAAMEERRNMEAAKILETGYAVTHQRVALLDDLTRRVMGLLDEKGITRRIHKGIGWGDEFKIIEEEEFREGEIKQVRGLLDDLAKETGGREKNVNLSANGLAGLLQNSKAFEDDDNIEDAEWEPVESDD